MPQLISDVSPSVTTDAATGERKIQPLSTIVEAPDREDSRFVGEEEQTPTTAGVTEFVADIVQEATLQLEAAPVEQNQEMGAAEADDQEENWLSEMVIFAPKPTGLSSTSDQDTADQTEREANKPAPPAQRLPPVPEESSQEDVIFFSGSGLVLAAASDVGDTDSEATPVPRQQQDQVQEDGAGSSAPGSASTPVRDRFLPQPVARAAERSESESTAPPEKDEGAPAPTNTERQNNDKLSVHHEYDQLLENKLNTINSSNSIAERAAAALLESANASLQPGRFERVLKSQEQDQQRRRRFHTRARMTSGNVLGGTGGGAAGGSGVTQSGVPPRSSTALPFPPQPALRTSAAGAADAGFILPKKAASPKTSDPRLKKQRGGASLGVAQHLQQLKNEKHLVQHQTQLKQRATVPTSSSSSPTLNHVDAPPRGHPVAPGAVSGSEEQQNATSSSPSSPLSAAPVVPPPHQHTGFTRVNEVVALRKRVTALERELAEKDTVIAELRQGLTRSATLVKEKDERIERLYQYLRLKGGDAAAAAAASPGAAASEQGFAPKARTIALSLLNVEDDGEIDAEEAAAEAQPVGQEEQAANEHDLEKDAMTENDHTSRLQAARAARFVAEAEDQHETSMDSGQNVGAAASVCSSVASSEATAAKATKGVRATTGRSMSTSVAATLGQMNLTGAGDPRKVMRDYHRLNSITTGRGSAASATRTSGKSKESSSSSSATKVQPPAGYVAYLKNFTKKLAKEGYAMR